MLYRSSSVPREADVITMKSKLFFPAVLLLWSLFSSATVYGQTPPSNCSKPSKWNGQDDDNQGRDAPGCIRDAMKRRYDFAVRLGGYLQRIISPYDTADVYYYDYGLRTHELNVPYCVQWRGNSVGSALSSASFNLFVSRRGSSSGLRAMGSANSGMTFKFSSAARVYFAISTSSRGGHYIITISRNRTCGRTYNYCPSRCSSNSDCHSCQGKPKCSSGKCIADNNKCKATPGYYCLNTIKLRCGSNAYYCTGDGQRRSVSRGHYATGGTSTTRTGQSVCPKGSYCTNGVRYSCPSGTTTSGTGAYSKTQCTGGGSGTCRANPGYYCSNGRAVACGGSQYYCPGGTNGKRYTATRGYYNYGGTPNTRTGQRRCEAGYYCISGVRLKCPAGTTSAAGAYHPSLCKKSGTCKARAGYYCNNGVETKCGGYNWYCPGGTNAKRYANKRGWYTTGGTAYTRTGQKICEIGYYCVAGVRRKCPTGTSNLRPGAYHPTFCFTPCKAKAGHYCKEIQGSFGHKAEPCGGNAYYCKGGDGKAATRTKVSDGHYSTGGTSTTRTGQSICPKGSYCTGGEKLPCPAGTTTASTGARDKSQCQSTSTGETMSSESNPSQEVTQESSQEPQPTDVGSTNEGSSEQNNAGDAGSSEHQAEPLPEPTTESSNSQEGSSAQEGGTNRCSFDSECPGEQICINGACVDAGCYLSSCGTDQYCKGGKCVVDPCSGNSCSLDEYCHPESGRCLLKCPTCKSGERCDKGQCKQDPCAQVKCGSGERCEDGKCVKDACLGNTKASCKFGRMCSKGICKDDPCAHSKCGNGYTCSQGTCQKKPGGTTELQQEPSAESITKEDTAQDEHPQEESDGGDEVDTAGKPDDWEDFAADDWKLLDSSAHGEAHGGEKPSLPPGGCDCNAYQDNRSPMFLLLLFGLVLLFIRRYTKHSASSQ